MSDSLNLKMIEELEELMAEDFPMLIDTFLTDCEKRLMELNIAISENSSVKIREIAHGFKGSSSNLGAVKLSEYSRLLEEMGRNDELSDADQVLMQLSDEYQLVKKYFKALTFN